MAFAATRKDLEIITLSEVRQWTQTSCATTYMQNLKKKGCKWTYLQNRNRLIDLEKLMVIKRDMWGKGGVDWGFGMEMF